MNNNKLIIVTLTIFILSFSICKSEENLPSNKDSTGNSTRVKKILCTAPAYNKFPKDLFTQYQRTHGALALHFFAVIWVCCVLVVLCEEYFVPSLENICEYFNLTPDIAGATFMAVGSSAPELFSALIEVYLNTGDFALQTIAGSAVYNMLGITGILGLLVWNNPIKVYWFPIIRDCIFYSMALILLFIALEDKIITMNESIIFICLYVIYIFGVYFNEYLEMVCLFIKFKITGNKALVGYLVNNHLDSGGNPKTFRGKQASFNQLEKMKSDLMLGQQKKRNFFSSPKCEILPLIWWISMWIPTTLFRLTIIDCRKPKLKKLFFITFILSVIWLGIISYLLVWVVTIIGYTLKIPTSASDLSMLAITTSIPETISNAIVVRQGLANMALSTLIGSNMFDILLCLGLPWLLMNCFVGELKMESDSLTAITISMFLITFLFLGTFMLHRWTLNKILGLTLLFFYIAFLVFGILMQLNYFGEVSLPQCKY